MAIYQCMEKYNAIYFMNLQDLVSDDIQQCMSTIQTQIALTQ